MRIFEVTPSDTMALSSSRLACETKGSFASFGKLGRICASLSRISCMATLISVPIANSTITKLEFSREREVIFFTPAMVLSAFSIGLVRSLSTACGLAPGYCTTVKANGKFTSGMASIGSRKYDTAPITMSANITMVQNTGFLIATRVIHIAQSP